MPQSLARILVHVVFSMKHRQPLIKPEIEDELFKYMCGTLREHESPALAINGTEDHVHILISLSRKVALSDLLEEAKKSSSKWIKTKGPEYKNFYWQNGFGAFSIGESGVPALKKYIAEQKEHHLKKTFQEEFREFLKLYNIEYDERYVWV
ncbi:MAG: IS200/IS605 family transposase [bacterium]